MTFLPWVASYSKPPPPALNHPSGYFSAWEMGPLPMSHWSLFSGPWNLLPLKMIFSARKATLHKQCYCVLINSQCRKQWSYWRKLRTCLFGGKIFWNMMIWFRFPPDLTILHKRHVTSAQHFALSFTMKPYDCVMNIPQLYSNLRETWNDLVVYLKS